MCMDAHGCKGPKRLLDRQKLPGFTTARVRQSTKLSLAAPACFDFRAFVTAVVAQYAQMRGSFRRPTQRLSPLASTSATRIVKGSLVTGKRGWEVYEGTITPES